SIWRRCPTRTSTVCWATTPRLMKFPSPLRKECAPVNGGDTMPGDKRALLRQWMECGQIRFQPLTFPQRELWEASPVPVADMANHICCCIEIRGKVTLEDGMAALQQVVERQ